MSWRAEIVRAFFVAFGAMEILTNGAYLTWENKSAAARKQHSELPKKATDGQVKVKVICMFLFGFLFFCVGFNAYYKHTYPQLLFVAVTTLYMVYVLVEAVVYRYWKTWCAFLVSALLLLIAAWG